MAAPRPWSSPEKFLQCVSSASSHEVIDEVSVIVSDIAEEYGLTPAVEVSRAKAYVAEKADQDEVIEPAEVGRQIFEDRPDVQQVYEERVREAKLPEEAPVRRGVANRLTKSHKIRTDTGVEISFPVRACRQARLPRLHHRFRGPHHHQHRQRGPDRESLAEKGLGRACPSPGVA